MVKIKIYRRKDDKPMEKDYNNYFNKGNDCDSCENQYLSGNDGDAIGCKCSDSGIECCFIGREEQKIIIDCENCNLDGTQECEMCEKRVCRVCGCTWNNACPGGCYWVEKDLCSECVGVE